MSVSPQNRVMFLFVAICSGTTTGPALAQSARTAPTRRGRTARIDSSREKPLSLVQAEDIDQTQTQNSASEESPSSNTAPDSDEDIMEDIQSFNTYTSLEDGQPGQRGELQINYFNGWQTQSHESDPWQMLMELEYSPNVKGCWFLQNA